MKRKRWRLGLRIVPLTSSARTQKRRCMIVIGTYWPGHESAFSSWSLGARIFALVAVLGAIAFVVRLAKRLPVRSSNGSERDEANRLGITVSDESAICHSSRAAITPVSLFAVLVSGIRFRATATVHTLPGHSFSGRNATGHSYRTVIYCGARFLTRYVKFSRSWLETFPRSILNLTARRQT